MDPKSKQSEQADHIAKITGLIAACIDANVDLKKYVELVRADGHEVEIQYAVMIGSASEDRTDVDGSEQSVCTCGEEHDEKSDDTENQDESLTSTVETATGVELPEKVHTISDEDKKFLNDLGIHWG